MSTVFLALATTYLAVVLAAILIIDLKTYRIPNSLNLALLCGGVFVSLALGQPPLAILLGAFAGGSSLWFIRHVYARRTGIEGLGLGDVKFMVAAGAWTGWQGIAPLLVVASLTGILGAVMQSLVGRVTLSRQQVLPFGPFLSLALLIIFLAQSLGFAPWLSGQALPGFSELVTRHEGSLS
jgi:leader peptidase (prepilin peptidase)/N-methyltransferase